MWRCLNDIFGYCECEPEPDIEPKEMTIILSGSTSRLTTPAGGHCALNPLTCGKYLTFSEKHRQTVLPVAPITK